MSHNFKDNFAHWDERALARAKQASPFFNDALLTEEDKQDIEQALRNKATKAIRFRDDGHARPPEARIDEVLLFQQFAAALTLRHAKEKDAYKRAMVRHQIETSAERQRLSQWNKRAEHVEPLLAPLHFQIYGKRSCFKQLREGEMGQMEQLQHALARSHFEPEYLAPRDLVQKVEHYMGVTAVRLLLHQHLLLILFEWEDVQHFALVLGFTLQLTRGQAKTAQALLAEQMISLTREDLLSAQDEEGMAVEGLEGQVRALKQELQSGFISYVTAGYVKRESA